MSWMKFSILLSAAIIGSTLKGTQSIRCLHCYGVIQPRHCHVIKVCQQGELCFTERYENDRSEILYNIGCRSNSSCQVRGNDKRYELKLQQRNSYVPCSECCPYDVCNSQGCGEPGLPVQRGPLCYSCLQTRDPATCNTFQICDTNEMCSIEEKQEFSDVFYTTGCVRTQICDAKNYEAPVVGKRETGIKQPTKCNRCCSGELCNDNCGNFSLVNRNTSLITASTTTETIVTPTAQAKSGHVGYEYILMFCRNYNRDIENLEVMATTTSVSAELTMSMLTAYYKSFPSTHHIYNKTINFNFHDKITSTARTIEPKGLYINSTEPISIYALSYSSLTRSAEGYYALPVNKLGYEYKAVSFPVSRISSENDRSVIAIVASEDNTDINITFAFPTLIGSHTYSYGEKYHKINIPARLGTFSLESSSDLTGTSIISNKPIGFLSGNTCNPYGGGGCNHMIEYIPPVKEWGKMFIIPPIPSSYSTSSKIVIVSSTSHNVVNLTKSSGSTNSYKIYIRQTLSNLYNNKVYIVNTEEPVLVSMYAYNHYRNAFMTAVPSVDQFSNNYIVTTPTFVSFENFLAIIVDSKFSNELLFDNQTIASMNIQPLSIVTDFKVTWQVLTVSLSSSIHSVKHPSSSVKFGLIQYGFRKGQSYAFPVGLDLISEI